jgi:hypothetical protein
LILSDNETTKDSSDTKTSKEYSPTSNTSEERRVSVFENPLFNNNNGDLDPQSPQHKRPKWVEQLLKDVHSNEMNKTGTRGSSRS